MLFWISIFLKKVNDTYGHKGGDFILKEFSKLLKKSLRPYDFIGRIGGEEFEIAFENESVKNVHKVLDRIRNDIDNSIFVYKDIKIKMTFSAGICDFSEINHDGAVEEKLFALADKRLYKAKESGRNKIISEI